jgi:hypothetical protein
MYDEGDIYRTELHDNEQPVFVVQPSRVAFFYDGRGEVVANAAPPTCVQVPFDPEYPDSPPSWMMTVVNPNSLYSKVKISLIDGGNSSIMAPGVLNDCEADDLSNGYEVTYGTITCLLLWCFLSYFYFSDEGATHCNQTALCPYLDDCQYYDRSSIRCESMSGSSEGMRFLSLGRSLSIPLGF